MAGLFWDEYHGSVPVCTEKHDHANEFCLKYELTTRNRDDFEKSMIRNKFRFQFPQGELYAQLVALYEKKTSIFAEIDKPYGFDWSIFRIEPPEMLFDMLTGQRVTGVDRIDANIRSGEDYYGEVKITPVEGVSNLNELVQEYSKQWRIQSVNTIDNVTMFKYKSMPENCDIVRESLLLFRSICEQFLPYNRKENFWMVDFDVTGSDITMRSTLFRADMRLVLFPEKNIKIVKRPFKFRCNLGPILKQIDQLMDGKTFSMIMNTPFLSFLMDDKFLGECKVLPPTKYKLPPARISTWFNVDKEWFERSEQSMRFSVKKLENSLSQTVQITSIEEDNKTKVYLSTPNHRYFLTEATNPSKVSFVVNRRMFLDVIGLRRVFQRGLYVSVPLPDDEFLQFFATSTKQSISVRLRRLGVSPISGKVQAPKPFEIELLKRDIAETVCEALVNAANSGLHMGSGVAGSLKRKGGPKIEKEALEIAEKRRNKEIDIGESVATTAGMLNAKYVIHTAIMGIDRQTNENYIRMGTRSALELADKLKVACVAFPAFGTGVGGFDKRKCAEIMIEEILKYRNSGISRLQHVLLVSFDDITYKAFEEALKNSPKKI